MACGWHAVEGAQCCAPRCTCSTWLSNSAAGWSRPPGPKMAQNSRAPAFVCFQLPSTILRPLVQGSRSRSISCEGKQAHALASCLAHAAFKSHAGAASMMQQVAHCCLLACCRPSVSARKPDTGVGCQLSTSGAPLPSTRRPKTATGPRYSGPHRWIATALPPTPPLPA